MMEVDSCDVFNSFWYSQIVLHSRATPIYKQAHTLILPTSALVLTIPLQRTPLQSVNGNDLYCL